ncbi:MAG TPA: hypothetical protein VNW73_15050, partial [Ktedonobacteraceae bacterium]|nr:hypothetical protein [Ktedonobacteraceae bacterium]
GGLQIGQATLTQGTSASACATDMAAAISRRGNDRSDPSESPHTPLRDMEFAMVEKAEMR